MSDSKEARVRRGVSGLTGHDVDVSVLVLVVGVIGMFCGYFQVRCAALDLLARRRRERNTHTHTHTHKHTHAQNNNNTKMYKVSEAWWM